MILMNGRSFYIVRHGETKWNKQNRIQGHTDVPLTENGIKQAKHCAEALKDKKIDFIYTSDLSRAVQTADEINKFHNLTLRKTKNLREFFAGDCEGVHRDEINDKFPEFVNGRKEDYFNTPYPNGESYRDVQERAGKFIEEISEVKGEILIVAHQGINRVFIGKLIGLEDEEMRSIGFPHDIVYCIDENNKISYLQNRGMHEGILKRERLYK